VGTKIRALWARVVVLTVDDDDMSTAEYSIVMYYNRFSESPHACTGRKE
jgi:hypothetical protein